jgi:hypothetical protein
MNRKSVTAPDRRLAAAKGTGNATMIMMIPVIVIVTGKGTFVLEPPIGHSLRRDVIMMIATIAIVCVIVTAIVTVTAIRTGVAMESAIIPDEIAIVIGTVTAETNVIVRAMTGPAVTLHGVTSEYID